MSDTLSTALAPMVAVISDTVLLALIGLIGTIATAALAALVAMRTRLGDVHDKMTTVASEVHKVEVATNSMKDALVAAALALGIDKGIVLERARAATEAAQIALGALQAKSAPAPKATAAELAILAKVATKAADAVDASPEAAARSMGLPETAPSSTATVASAAMPADTADKRGRPGVGI